MSYPDQPLVAEHDLHDRLEVNLMRLGTVRLGAHWRNQDLAAPHWRLYCNPREGARLLPAGRPALTLQERRRYVVPPWVHFTGQANEGVEHIYCHFDVLGPSPALVRDVFPSPLALARDPDKEAALVDLGDDLASTGRITLSMACTAKAAVYAALSELFAMLGEAQRLRLMRQVRRDLPVQAALDHIHEHLASACSNDILAARCGVSSFHLIRQFRRHVGMTPARYLQDQRIAAAARALAYSDDAIEAIAERTGFPNRHYFTRVFSQKMGVPPAAYRRAQAM